MLFSSVITAMVLIVPWSRYYFLLFFLDYYYARADISSIRTAMPGLGIP